MLNGAWRDLGAPKGNWREMSFVREGHSAVTVLPEPLWPDGARKLTHAYFAAQEGFGSQLHIRFVTSLLQGGVIVAAKGDLLFALQAPHFCRCETSQMSALTETASAGSLTRMHFDILSSFPNLFVSSHLNIYSRISLIFFYLLLSYFSDPVADTGEILSQSSLLISRWGQFIDCMSLCHIKRLLFGIARSSYGPGMMNTWFVWYFIHD